jgi:cytochrome c553
MIALILALAAQDAVSVLESSCLRCHDAGNPKGGLDLSTRAGFARGGESGPAAGLLLQLVRHEADPKMPHKAPRLSDRAVAALAEWIAQGAPYPRTLRSRAELHWAFRPLRRPDAASIDELVRPPGPEASRAVLLRRAAFSVTGLPPGEDDGAAWDVVVDRLLASPAHGERWARHWLDVARYADSSGYESDFDRPASHQYRDFVIRAFNDDLPYDEFVSRQVAGDLLDDLAATGFLAVGPWMKTLPTDLERNKERYRTDNLDDVAVTTAQAFLGLTVGCARCHDHKYDPVSQRDYTRLVAAFAGIEPRDRFLSAPRRRLAEWLEERREAFKRSRIDPLPLGAEEKLLLSMPEDGNIVSSKRVHQAHGAAVKFTDAELRAWLTEADRADLGRLEREAEGRPAARALAVFQGPAPRTHLLGRGDPDHRLEEIAAGPLSAISPSGHPAFATKPPRLALAEWLTDVDHGAGALLARVVVNRLWQHHFGEGLVRTPNDFGVQGDPPSDPALLEWLGAELVARRWSLKAIHRLILRSAAYRQAGRRPVRLEAETLRDAVLAVSGRLNPAMYGPGVKLPVPKGAIVTRTKDAYPASVAPSDATRRRSLYAFVKRSVLLPWMETFDAPAPSASCGRRAVTTVAPQALALLNDPFVRDAARGLAGRAGGDPARAWRLALGREPSAAELHRARAFAADDSSFVDLCHLLFTLNEFAYVD